MDSPDVEPAAEANTRPEPPNIAQLWERSKPGMLERVDTLERAIAAMVHDSATDDQVADAQRIAHRIAGTAGMFGFGEASRIARAMEEALESDSVDVHQLADLAMALIDSFRPDAADVALRPAAPPDGIVAAGRLVIIDVDEPALRRRLLDTFVARGVNAVAWDRLPAHIPTAAYVVHLRDDSSRSRMVRYLPPRATAPLVAIVDSANTDDRVAAADAGAGLIVKSSDSADAVVDYLVGRLSSSNSPDGLTVMLIDDDPLVHDHVAAVTGHHGWQLTHILDPGDTWKALDTQIPDVLIIDLDMPNLDGLTLTRALRASLAYRNVPVFVLTASNDPETVDRAFAAGADDFLAKPLDPTVASARIRRHLQRAPVAPLSSAGSLTALPGKVELIADLRSLAQQAPGGPDGVTVAVIRLRGVDATTEARGSDASAEFVRRIVRQATALLDGTTLSHLGGYDIGWATHAGPQQVQEQLVRLFQGIRDTIDLPAPMLLHAGVAHSADGRNAANLIDSALDALVSIGDRSEDRVERYTAASQHVDVAIVEDDVLLADVVVQALRQDGLSTVLIGNGADALDQLGGATPKVRPRLILLDVDLPGMDGLDVLRQLSLDGITATTPVVLMTARTRESELLAAWQLGAVDHIAKPMSVPVLVERTRRAMRSPQ